MQRAAQNEIVALCLYWFVKVEIKDTKSLPPPSHQSNPNSNTTSNTSTMNSNSNSNLVNINTISSGASTTNGVAVINNGMNQQTSANIDNTNATSSGNTNNANSNDSLSFSLSNKSNFQIFMDELLNTLRNVTNNLFIYITLNVVPLLLVRIKLVYRNVS